MWLLINRANELHHLILMIAVNVVTFENWTLTHPELMRYHSMINAMLASVSMALVKNQKNLLSLETTTKRRRRRRWSSGDGKWTTKKNSTKKYAWCTILLQIIQLWTRPFINSAKSQVAQNEWTYDWEQMNGIGINGEQSHIHKHKHILRVYQRWKSMNDFIFIKGSILFAFQME